MPGVSTSRSRARRRRSPFRPGWRSASRRCGCSSARRPCPIADSTSTWSPSRRRPGDSSRPTRRRSRCSLAGDPARARRAGGRDRGTLATPRYDAPAGGGVERGARPRLAPGRGPAQLDRLLPEAARGAERQGGRIRVAGGRLDDRLGLRRAQGLDHSDRPHGRSHVGRTRGAAGFAQRLAVVTYRVVLADRVAESGVRLLAETREIEVVSLAGKPRDELERALAGAHALVVRSETHVTADLLACAPRLQVVARAGAGVDTIDVHAATRRGIAVMNAPGANTVSAAEHAMGLLLALVRRIPWAAEAMRRGEWDRKRFEGTELRGKTIGVVGLGRIGGHVAQVARAFGMQVIAHDPYLPRERAAELQVKLLPLDQLLRQADVVTLHVAHTEQTHHLINAERLKLMKRTAVLINTARGELVD